MQWIVENVWPLLNSFAVLISLALAIAAYRRDRANIRLEFDRDMSILNSSVYDPDKTYGVLSVTNRGRRSVSIVSAGYRLYSGNGGVFSDSGLNIDRTIDERKASTDFFAEQGQLPPTGDIWYYFAKDSAGRSYRLHPHIFWWARLAIRRVWTKNTQATRMN